MRLNKLKKILRSGEKTPYLITDLSNIRYLTGFTGSYANLIVDDKKSYIISDSRYEEYINTLINKSTEFLLQKADLNSTIKNLLKKIKRKKLYLEEHSLTLAAFGLMKRQLRGVKIIPSGNEVNIIRMVKDVHEINLLRKAAEITDKCFKHIRGFIKPGILEWEIAVEIEYFYRNNGCRKTSFDSIVATGEGSSMPHYETSMIKKVKKNDIVLIDMGCLYEGYNSDLTRTIFLNSIDPEIEKIYNIVRNAQETAISKIKPGITAGKVDKFARDIISKEGYADMFGHSLGHGFGLEVHELPALKKDGEIRIKKNMTVTVEPGIYIPGLGGVRIEDMVLVTARGFEILTKSTKDIIIIK